MIGVDEPLLHALSATVRCARAGDEVTFRFRARNHGSRASGALGIRFLPSGGLTALSPLDVALPAVSPGEDAVATLRCRIASGLDDRSTVSARAELRVEERTLVSNVCPISVRTRARFDGDACATTIEPLDDGALRVSAFAVNRGDGPARNVVLHLPVPGGWARLDGDGAASAFAERLAPGERIATALDVRIVDPMRELAPLATLSFAGSTYTLRPAQPFAPAAALAAPQVVVRDERDALALIIDLPNAGWVDARDVAVRIELPPPVRLRDQAVLVDGVPVAVRGTARARRWTPFAVAVRADGGIALVLARIPARGAARIDIALRVPAGRPSLAVRVDAGGRSVEHPLASATRRDLRVRLIEPVPNGEPGGVIPLAVEVINAGTQTERVRFRFDAPGVAAAEDAPRLVAAGALERCALALRLPYEIADGAHAGVLVAEVDDGAPVRVECTFAVDGTVGLVLDEPPFPIAAGVSYPLRNGGNTVARGLTAVFGTQTYDIAALGPGETTTLIVDSRVACSGGELRAGERGVLVLPAPDEDDAGAVRAVLRVEEPVVAGIPFAVHVELEADGDGDAVELRILEPEGAHVIAGSTTVDGITLVDHKAPAPVRGIRLCGVQRGTRIGIGWRMSASRECDALEIGGVLDVDGILVALDPACVAVAGRDGFAGHVRANGYVIDGSVIALPAARPPREPIAATSVPPGLTPAPHVQDADGTVRADAPAERFDEPQVMLATDLTPARRSEIHRLLADGGGTGLLPHILALRALFPDRVVTADAAAAASLEPARTALRDVFDRLFVKRRIPGFPIGVDDLEDPPLRRGVAALLPALVRAANGAAQETGEHVALRTLDRRTLESALAALAGAALGAPAVLRALLLLVPTACAGDVRLGAALDAYVGELDAALERCDVLPLEAFERALTDQPAGALERARATLLAALGTEPASRASLR